MSGAPPQESGFPARFEAAQARLRLVAEEAYASATAEPERIAMALHAIFEFASLNPDAARVLTSEALAYGHYGSACYEELLVSAARILARCRADFSDGVRMLAVTERVLVGGIALIVAQRLEGGRAEELPSLAPEAIEFILAHYVGAKDARAYAHVAASGQQPSLRRRLG